VRNALVALALVYFVAHAACLPSTFADVDGINFALGVRDFDVSRHQPHPPGYPVFIAGAKASTAVLGTIGVPDPEVRGLAIWSALSGALLIPLLFLLYRTLVDDRAVAAWGAVVAVASPLLWFNGFRPLSDVPGLAIVVLVHLLLCAVVLRPPPPARAARWLVAGALAAGVAMGLRSQTFVLTLPLLGVAVLMPRRGLREKDRLAAVAAVIVGTLLWVVPLLIASGGPEAYLLALGNQAGEDFTGVVMLWTARTPRVAATAIANSFLWPWGSLGAGAVVVALAVAGAGRMLIRARWALVTLVVAFAPYAVFHLLFHETVTTRYALPLVVPVVLLAVYALAGMGRVALHVGGAALAAWSVVATVPASRTYGSTPTPPYRALQDALAATSQGDMVAMHAGMLRPEQWYHDNASRRIYRRLHARELPGLVDLWRTQPRTSVSFIANPRRSDLAMLDPRARELTRSYDWGFPEFPLLGGVRPGAVQLFTLRAPGWMLGEGWAVTPEVGGQTTRLGAGPHRRPAIAWVRARGEAAMLMIGGRDFGPATARISIRSAERVIQTFDAPPGFFFKLQPLSPGLLTAADAYLPLEVTATPVDGQEIHVDLEQFDLQSDGVPMVGVVTGWHEPEYNPATGRTWRWMSERATLWVRPVGRDLTLTITGESPLRYFSAPPALQMIVAGQVVGRLQPTDDFTWVVTIPAALLPAANEEVVIQSDSSFVPGDGDLRNLALRVYSISVN
jgi:hypothetical protein